MCFDCFQFFILCLLFSFLSDLFFSFFVASCEGDGPEEAQRKAEEAVKKEVELKDQGGAGTSNAQAGNVGDKAP